MDKTRIEGLADKAIGTVKSAVGGLVGDTKLKMEGEAQKAAGHVENAVGSAKDAKRDLDDKR